MWSRVVLKPATTIEKVCRIFAAFRSKPFLGVTELADRTGLLPSDVHRILRSLQCFGYIEQDESKKYRLGLELLKLGHLVHHRIELLEVARPLMRRLSVSVLATVNLAVFDSHDLEMVFIEQIDPPAETRIGHRIGASLWPHATAVGKVLLATLDQPTASAVIEKHGLPRRTRHTICDIPALHRELAVVRDQAYALDREEAVAGARCVAAPLLDHGGQVVAALSVSFSSADSAIGDEARLIGAVQLTASKISAQLGHEDGSRLGRRSAAHPPRGPGNGASPHP